MVSAFDWTGLLLFSYRFSCKNMLLCSLFLVSQVCTFKGCHYLEISEPHYKVTWGKSIVVWYGQCSRLDWSQNALASGKNAMYKVPIDNKYRLDKLNPHTNLSARDIGNSNSGYVVHWHWGLKQNEHYFADGVFKCLSFLECKCVNFNNNFCSLCRWRSTVKSLI